jgi:hypothetical protein
MTIQRGQHMGTWLPLLPSTVNRTELLAQEFWDAISMRYGLVPPDLPAHCDGCNAPSTLLHALRSEISWSTWQGKPWHPLQYATSPWIDLVALQRKTLLAPPMALTRSWTQKINSLVSRVATYFFKTSTRPEEPIVLWTFMSLTQIPNHTANNLQTKSSSQEKNWRRKSTPRHASSNNLTSPPLSAWWMAC